MAKNDHRFDMGHIMNTDKTLFGDSRFESYNEVFQKHIKPSRKQQKTIEKYLESFIEKYYKSGNFWKVWVPDARDPWPITGNFGGRAGRKMDKRPSGYKKK